MSDFLTEYFLNPILLNGWFNPVNTALWGVILMVAAFLVYSKLLKKMKVHIDRRFAIAILPFIFWASSTRVLRDMAYGLAERASAGSPVFLTDISYQTGLVQQQAFAYVMKFVPLPAFAGFFSWIIALFPTPGSYVFTFLFALGVLLLSLGIQRFTNKTESSKRRRQPQMEGDKSRLRAQGRLPAIEYWKPMFLIGLAACAINAIMIPWGANLAGIGIILGITAAFAAGFFGLTYLQEKGMKSAKKSFLGKFSRLGIFSRVNSTLLSAHILDSAATFTSVAFFGYYEQHPVPRLFIEAIGPWTFFIVKLAVLIPSLYIIDRYAEDGEFKTFLKIVILILGLAPGLRDSIRLVAGV